MNPKIVVDDLFFLKKKSLIILFGKNRRQNVFYDKVSNVNPKNHQT